MSIMIYQKLRKGANITGRAGFTLTEAVITLCIMGIVLGSIWVAAGHVWSNVRFNKIMEQTMTVAQNIRDHYGPMGKLVGCAIDFTGIVDDDDRKLIPVDMRLVSGTEGKAINHAVGSRGGNANAGTFVVECNSDRSFKIRLRDLRKEHCVKLLMEFPVLIPELGVTKMTAPSGDTGVINARIIDSPASVPLPMTLVNATAWCSSAATNEVSFDFSLLN